MNIRDFVSSMNLRLASLNGSVSGPDALHFPPGQTDTLMSEDGELLVAINRETGRFVAQRGGCVSGNTNADLDKNEVDSLMGKSTISFNR